MKVEPGATVHIDLPSGDTVTGAAVWARGGQVGVRFESELAEGHAFELGLLKTAPRAQVVVIEPLEQQPKMRHWLSRARSAARQLRQSGS